MIIDITHAVTGVQKADVLKEMLEWLHINAGEYLAYDGDVNKVPYNYAIGKGWKILVHHEEQSIIRAQKTIWFLDIKDEALGEVFILKFL
jgi:hypothetical protein